MLCASLLPSSPPFLPFVQDFHVKMFSKPELKTIFPDQVDAHGKYNQRMSSLKADNSCRKYQTTQRSEPGLGVVSFKWKIL